MGQTKRIPLYLYPAEKLQRQIHEIFLILLPYGTRAQYYHVEVEDCLKTIRISTLTISTQ